MNMPTSDFIKSDEELVELAKKGDDASYQELMRRSLKPVYNFVYTYVRTPEETDDITQDTFFKAWKFINQFKSEKKWRPWIFTIARNTALDHIKKKRAVPFSNLDDKDSSLQFSENIEDTEPLADQLFENAQNATEISVALKTLRAEYQSVIMLHYHQELTFEEIASVMGTPMNTVKSWHRRALEDIRRILSSPTQIKAAPK